MLCSIGFSSRIEALGGQCHLLAVLAQGACAGNNTELWPYLAQGVVGYAICENDLSMAALTRAVELSSNSVNAHGLLGNAHAFGRRFEAASSSIQHAMRLSPRDTFLSDFVPLWIKIRDP
jgi:hypothetical protein